MSIEILTENLRLLLGTRDAVLAWVNSMSPSDRAEVSPAWLAKIEQSTASDPWLHGYTLVHRESGDVVGSCGFKGPPDAESVVEIAYGVQPDYQGRGFATEAARALTDFALRNDGVKTVRAHTRPEKSASTRVLAKCGFEKVGEVIDPEDGPVWRWELAAAPRA